MAETLLALLLVTSSANGSSLVYHWPECPVTSPRLARARPSRGVGSLSQLDNPCRAIALDSSGDRRHWHSHPENHSNDDEEYEWKRPNTPRKRSASFPRGGGSVPPSGRSSPVKDGGYDLDGRGNSAVVDEYDDLLGYSSKFLAGILCPQRSLCHQKFELIVDDLAFIGHPVCAEADGAWRFKTKPSVRGRGHRTRESSLVRDRSDSPLVNPDQEGPTSADNTWLNRFHFVIVLDLPDPSSSASGNVLRYFDIIYEQIAFTVTAVLFQQQVVSNFVESECDILGSLKDEYISRGEPYANYMKRALEVSSIAPAMKTIYEAIKNSVIAHVTIDNLPLELQLPPYLDKLLHSEEDVDIDFIEREDDEADAWGKDMSLAWRLPTLAPWKALLLLVEDEPGVDPYGHLRGPYMNSEERRLAQGLLKFLDLASVRLPLGDMAIELDWDLETQLYPVVRWLVYHRHAKVVDVVHEGLKTVFTVSSSLSSSISVLSREFSRAFPQNIPTLPTILSLVSGSTSQQTDNTFFAAVVRAKELVPVYHDVVEWMLKKELLVTMHLRVRVVATPGLKARVRENRKDRGMGSRKKIHIPGRGGGDEGGFLRADLDLDVYAQASPPTTFLSLSPRAVRRHAMTTADLSPSAIEEEEDNREDDAGESGCDGDVEGLGDGDDFSDMCPSLIDDPGRAEPAQRCWLAAMSDGKDVSIARRFEQINQYFDGKKTDDEILFRAEISRKQLREVLHHYEEYLQTFLHPS